MSPRIRDGERARNKGGGNWGAGRRVAVPIATAAVQR
jgi:hypothetical protein